MSEERGEVTGFSNPIRVYRAAPMIAALMAIDTTREPPPSWCPRASVRKKRNPNAKKQAAAKRARKTTRRSSP